MMRIERTHSRSHAISLLLIARCRALVVKFLGGDVRIELSDYGDVRGLVVDGKPGFSPRGVDNYG